MSFWPEFLKTIFWPNLLMYHNFLNHQFFQFKTLLAQNFLEQILYDISFIYIFLIKLYKNQSCSFFTFEIIFTFVVLFVFWDCLHFCGSFRFWECHHLSGCLHFSRYFHFEVIFNFQTVFILKSPSSLRLSSFFRLSSS